MPRTLGKIPTSEDQVYHVRLGEADRMRIQAVAERKGLPVSTFIRMLVLEWLEKEGGNGR